MLAGSTGGPSQKTWYQITPVLRSGLQLLQVCVKGFSNLRSLEQVSTVVMRLDLTLEGEMISPPIYKMSLGGTSDF